MLYYCYECDTAQYDDELGTERELIDPRYPASEMVWTVCGHCQSDNVAEVDAGEIRTLISELEDWFDRQDFKDKTGRHLLRAISSTVEVYYE